MTGNRTTEHTASELVKAMLDERGADYRMRQSVTNGSMNYYDRYTVFIDGNPRAFIDTGNGDEVVLTLRCTPEQAIAATLGMQREADDYFYLPKPKVPLVEFNSELDFEHVDGGVKMTRMYDISNAAIRAWGEQLDRQLMERICEVFSATLGRPKAKSHPYGYERDTGAYDCTRCECGCINDISATYCNDCGGEIEIDESAEKEYYDGYSKRTVFAKKHDDGSLEFCERRYVPEDAELGNERELIDLAHNAWSMALCAMQGMPIPAEWGNNVEQGLRKYGINVDEELTGFEVIDE